MLPMTIDLLVDRVGGEVLLEGSQRLVTSLAIDSRAVEAGSVFVAFGGEVADGHEYLVAAADRGAVALLVTRPLEEIDAQAIERCTADKIALIQVKDALSAVQKLGAAQRRMYRCPVVGITGSTGKTSTKDLVRAALASTFTTVSTKANQNNELGVPLTLLSGDADTEAFVVEMGMRGAGQIAELCEIADPTIGLITNIGTSHIELLGSEENIVLAKAELLRALSPDGCAILNGDDAHTPEIAKLSAAPIITYGTSEGNDLIARDIKLDQLSKARFTVYTEDETVEVALGVPGRYNVYNALAALAVARCCNIPLARAAEALAEARLTQMRMEILDTASGVTVINDAYNANPTSMKAALETLATMRGTGRKIAVLGDMAELGKLTELAHFELGATVADTQIDLLVTVGDRARRIGEGAKSRGMEADAIHMCETKEEAFATLRPYIQSGDAVLVKGSRVVGLESIVEGLVTPDA